MSVEEGTSATIAVELDFETRSNDLTSMENASFGCISSSEAVSIPNIPVAVDTETRPILNSLYRQDMTIKLANSKLSDWGNIHTEVVDTILPLFQNGDKDQENRTKLSLEFEYLTVIRNSTLQSVGKTANELSEKYESRLFSRLKSCINREKDFGNLKNLVNEIHERLLTSELQQLHPEDAEIIKVLINDKVKRLKRSALEAKHFLENYESIMSNHFLENPYFSLEVLEDLHRKAIKDVLKTNNHSNELQSFVEHVLSLQKNKFQLYNARIRKQEQQTVEAAVKNFHRSKQQAFIQSGIRRNREIKGYHEEICNICIDIVTQKINLENIGLNIDDLLAQLNVTLKEYEIANEIKMDRAIEEINKTIGVLQSKFYSDLNKKISEYPRTDTEFKGLFEKAKNKLLNELNDKIERLCPEEKDSRYTKMLLQMIETHGVNLRKENNAKLTEEENKGCELPLIAIDFCIKYSQVAILLREAETDLLKHAIVDFGTGRKVNNVVTFSLNGEFTVGESPNTTYGNETLQFITIEELLIEPNATLRNLTIPGKKDSIPINFQFISALIFRDIKQKCDKMSKCSYPTALIAVPIWFGSLKRQNIKDAATIAGFKQCFLINNTSAAALYHYKWKTSTYDYDSQTLSSRNKLSSQDEHLLVLTSDEAELCTAVYKKCQDGKIRMISNFGDCRFTKSRFYKQNIITTTYAHHPEDAITAAVVMSEDQTILTKFRDSFIKRDIPEYYHASGSQVLQGALIFGEALANTIVSARDSVLDKTFYNLCIYDKNRTNRIIINQGTSCLTPQEFSTAYNVPKTAQDGHSVKIYEDKGNEKQIVEFVQIKDPVHKRHVLFVNCTVNRENIFGINSATDSLDFKDSRMKNIQDYIKVIRNNLEKDEEMELKKNELKELVQHIQNNISKVNRVMQEDISIEAEKAMQRVSKPDFTKEEAQEFLNYFKRIKIRA